MICITGLKKCYGQNEIIKEIDLVVDHGEVVAIVGPSGSGKTTFLRSLIFLEEPTVGVIRIGDVEIDAQAPPARRKALVRALRLHVGFVFQNLNLFPHRTALENVIEGPIFVKKEPREAAIRRGQALLKKVGLAEKSNTYPSHLSGGQQQRVAIARALANDPCVILFDEPTSTLDPELVGEVLAVIRDLAKEKRTMIIVTHEMSFARDVADRTIFVDDGMIIEQGPSKEFFSAPREERTRKFLSKYLTETRGFPPL